MKDLFRIVGLLSKGSHQSKGPPDARFGSPVQKSWALMTQNIRILIIRTSKIGPLIFGSPHLIQEPSTGPTQPFQLRGRAPAGFRSRAPGEYGKRYCLEAGETCKVGQASGITGLGIGAIGGYGQYFRYAKKTRILYKDYSRGCSIVPR